MRSRFAFRRDSLFYFIVWVVLSLVAALIAALAINANWVATRERWWRRAETSAATAEETLDRSYEYVRYAGDLIRLREGIAIGDNQVALQLIDRNLDQLVELRRYGLRNLAIIDLDGLVRWSTSVDVIGRNAAGLDVVQAILQPIPPPLAVSAPRLGQLSREWLVHVATPIRDDAGTLTGIALVTIEADWLSNALMRQVEDVGEVIAIRRLVDGRIRAISRAPNNAKSRYDLDSIDANHPILEGAHSASRGRAELDDANDIGHLLVAWRLSPLLRMVIIVSYEWDDVFAQYRRLATTTWFAVISLILGGLGLVIGAIRNASLRQELATMAARDPLTGLENRRSLENRAAEILQAANRRNWQVACLLLDLDHFKQINDQYGHGAGDAVLKAVATAVQTHIRTSDIACRWGGEEMLVLLNPCSSAGAKARAEALRAVIAGTSHPVGQQVLQITASVGVACFPDDGKDLVQLMQSADAALYQAKAAGRNCVMMAERMELATTQAGESRATRAAHS